MTTDPAAVSGWRHPFGRDPRDLAAVFVGGAVGTGLRALFVVLFPTAVGQWPWPTFGVNVAGAVVLGYVATRLPPADRRRPLLGTGLCGGLTTFSTMQVEALGMIEAHDYGLAAGYLAASVAAGLLALHLTTRLVRLRGRYR